MKRAGFTLLELALVLAVIGVVLAVILPRLPASDAEDLKISARTLASTLRYMQDRASTARTTYILSVEPGTDKLRIIEAAADGSDKTPEDPLLQKRPVREGVIVADIIVPRLGKVNSEVVRLTAGAGGLRDFAVIHLQSPDGAIWTVMAFPSSGKVKVYKGYQETPP